jgi:hypothetical protein
MKKISSLLSIIILFTFFSCKKSDSTPDPSGSGTTEFKFVKLSAQDTLIRVNDFTTITAVATGEDLSYTWTKEFGTIIGSGATVQYTVCHVDKFRITCEVKDKYNHLEKRDVYVSTKE